MSRYRPVIGIETHVQLRTKSKLFCGCDNDAREAEPNTKICPVCLGLPGTLPVLNRMAIMLAIRAGLSLNGQIARRTKFDRKNYFYPDLPKGYQITQFDQPIVGAGSVEFPLDGQTVKVGITRAHLEEDAGKLTHPAGVDYTLVDLNRAGTPLLEIVSEPDMHTAAEAKGYAQEVYNLMRYAGVSDANLYYGNMRFDVNVSLSGSDGKLGTRTETKNLNSFRAVERAVTYEIKRQTELLDRGEAIIQETRGWDEGKQATVSQRSKEEAHDYRYFPEPDLPPVVISDVLLAAIKTELTMMPAEVRRRIEALGITASDRETLVAEPLLAEIFLAATEDGRANHASRIAGWLIGEVSRLVATGQVRLEELSPGTAIRLVELSEMVGAAKLSSTAAKTVLASLLKTGDDPERIAKRLQLLQVSDEGKIEAIVRQVIEANPQAVADFRSGNEAAVKFLVGQVMKESHGQANPPLAGAILRKQLGETA